MLLYHIPSQVRTYIIGEDWKEWLLRCFYVVRIHVRKVMSVYYFFVWVLKGGWLIYKLVNLVNELMGALVTMDRNVCGFCFISWVIALLTCFPGYFFYCE